MGVFSRESLFVHLTLSAIVKKALVHLCPRVTIACAMAVGAHMQQLSTEGTKDCANGTGSNLTGMSIGESIAHASSQSTSSFAEEKDDVILQSLYPYLLSKCDSLLLKLKKHPDAWPFMEPGV